MDASALACGLPNLVLPQIASTQPQLSLISASTSRLHPPGSAPLQLGNLLQLLTATVGIGFVGRLGPLELSASVLAVSVFNVTG